MFPYEKRNLHYKGSNNFGNEQESRYAQARESRSLIYFIYSIPEYTSMYVRGEV